MHHPLHATSTLPSQPQKPPYHYYITRYTTHYMPHLPFHLLSPRNCPTTLHFTISRPHDSSPPSVPPQWFSVSSLGSVHEQTLPEPPVWGRGGVQRRREGLWLTRPLGPSSVSTDCPALIIILFILMPLLLWPCDYPLMHILGPALLIFLSLFMSIFFYCFPHSLFAVFPHIIPIGLYFLWFPSSHFLLSVLILILFSLFISL